MYEADGSIVIDTEIRTGGMVPGTKEVEQTIRSMADTIRKMGTDAQIALQKQANAASRLNTQYAEQQKKIESIRRKMSEMAAKQVKTEDYKKLSAELQALEAAFAAVEQRETEWRQMGIPVDSAGYLELEKQLDEIYYKIERMQNKKAQMEANGTAYVDQSASKEYAVLLAQLEASENRLADIGNRLGVSYATLRQRIADVNPASSQFREIIASSVSPMQKVVGILRAMKSQLFGVDKAQKKVDKSSSAMRRGMKKTDSTTKNLSNSVFRLGNMFKLMLIRMAMRGVISSTREGLQKLAQYSDSTNRAISALISEMIQLRNSFSTTFANLIQYAQPALTQFISLLSQAVTWTAQLFAALAGKDTYVKAVKVQQDYADSLEKTTDSTKDAAKETQKAIAPFDELIQIIRTKKEDSSTDSGKNELKPEDMFTTEEVANDIKLRAEEIKNIFGKLFEPIKDSWDSHGTYAVQAAKSALGSLKQLAGDIGASFLQVWNDEGYGEGIASNLIITFGNLANIVANLTGRFGEAWAEADTGTSIIRHLGDILVTISGFFRQASESIKDWAAKLDFGPLLRSFDNVLAKMNPVVQSLGKILLWLLDNVLLPVAKWALECAVPAVLDLIAAGFDFLGSVLDALEPLATWLWEEFLQPFGEWAGETVIAAIQKVVEWLTKFSDWIRDHQEEVQNITLAVLAFFAAWKVVEFMSNVSRMIGSISNLMGALGGLDLKFGAIVLVITSIIYIAARVAKAWDKMTPGEKLATKIIAVAGAIALVVAAVAAFAHDVGTMVIAGSIAAIAGLSILGIASGAGSKNTSSVRSANPYSMASEAIRSYPVPHLATGTVVPPRAGEFLAVLGDNKRETEVVSPVSTIKQALLEAMEEYGGMGTGSNRTIKGDVYLDRQKLGRIVYELNNQESQRVGVRLVTEG